jgi:hypothetical protein
MPPSISLNVLIGNDAHTRLHLNVIIEKAAARAIHTDISPLL